MLHDVIQIISHQDYSKQVEVSMIIVTDTASDILESEAKSMDIKLITIPSIFEDETIDESYLY